MVIEMKMSDNVAATLI